MFIVGNEPNRQLKKLGNVQCALLKILVNHLLVKCAKLKKELVLGDLILKNILFRNSNLGGANYSFFFKIISLKTNFFPKLFNWKIVVMLPILLYNNIQLINLENRQMLGYLRNFHWCLQNQRDEGQNLWRSPKIILVQQDIIVSVLHPARKCQIQNVLMK